MKNPEIGILKTGDLNDIRVHYFKLVNQNYLLAYEYNKDSILLLSIGVHENFYRDLKKYRK